MFRAVSEHLYGTQAFHGEVRRACITYIEQHRDEFEPFLEGDFELYLFDMRQPKAWGGDVEWSALQRLYLFELTIFREVPVPHVDPQHAPPLALADSGLALTFPKVC